MALPSGRQLGSYEILGSLGAGGMGEVEIRPDAIRKILESLGLPSRAGTFDRHLEKLDGAKEIQK